MYALEKKLNYPRLRVNKCLYSMESLEVLCPETIRCQKSDNRKGKQLFLTCQPEERSNENILESHLFSLVFCMDISTYKRMYACTLALLGSCADD